MKPVNPYPFAAEYIDAGFWKVSDAVAHELAGGRLPSPGMERHVQTGKHDVWLARTRVDRKTVWSVRDVFTTHP